MLTSLLALIGSPGADYLNAYFEQKLASADYELSRS